MGSQVMFIESSSKLHKKFKGETMQKFNQLQKTANVKLDKIRSESVRKGKK